MCSPELDLTPIASVGQVFDEAREMQHCVAQRIDDAIAGNALLFRGVVYGERVTVEVARGGAGRLVGAWTLRDFRKRRNAPPGPAATAAIQAWATCAVACQQATEIAVLPAPLFEHDPNECPI